MNRYIKWFSIGLLVLVAIFFLGGLLIPAEWKVSESITIEASKEEVHSYVENLQKWQVWTPWTKEKDETLTYNYEGPETGVGAKSIWTSKKMGSGSIEIKESHLETGITYALFIDMGMESHLQGEISYLQLEKGVQVTWTDRGNSDQNLIKRWMSLLIQPMLSKELKEGLSKLKTLTETR